MSLSAARQPITGDGLGAAVRRLAVVWPTLTTAIYLALLILPPLSAGHWNAYTFVQFGHPLASWMHLPAGAPTFSDGFDGQIYWLQARDPLLLHHATLAALAHVFPGYHLQRVAYPALAWLLAAGRTALLPWTMLAIDVVVAASTRRDATKVEEAEAGMIWWGATKV